MDELAKDEGEPPSQDGRRLSIEDAKPRRGPDTPGWAGCLLEGISIRASGDIKLFGEDGPAEVTTSLCARNHTQEVQGDERHKKLVHDIAPHSDTSGREICRK